jgi:hypothetical protein
MLVFALWITTVHGNVLENYFCKHNIYCTVEIILTTWSWVKGYVKKANWSKINTHKTTSFEFWGRCHLKFNAHFKANKIVIAHCAYQKMHFLQLYYITNIYHSIWLHAQDEQWTHHLSNPFTGLTYCMKGACHEMVVERSPWSKSLGLNWCLWTIFSVWKSADLCKASGHRVAHP